jgi:hypothetical protein
MNIPDRVKRLLLAPEPEWSVIAAEPATLGGLITGYVLPMAALATIGSLVGSVLWLGGVGLGIALRIAVVSVVTSIVGVVVLSAVIDALAPTFGAAKNSANAAKVAAYSPTAAWVGGFFQIIPYLGSVIAFIGAIYSLYLLYLGLMRVMKSPSDKAVGYTVVVVVVAIVLGYAASLVTAAIGFGPAMRIL